MGEPLSVEIALPDAAATESLGQALAAALAADSHGWLVLLRGELGAGKTTTARAMLEALGHDGVVPSPTYTLVEPYELPAGTIYHVDLYRISDESELEFLGWTDLREGLVLVEWPERAPTLTRDADLEIRLDYDADGRRATVTARSARAGAVLQALT